MKYQQDANPGQDASVDNPSVLPEPTATYQGNRPMLSGSHNSVIQQNVKELMNRGTRERDAHKMALAHAKRGGKSQHKNLGKFLHPRKDGKPHGSDKNMPGVD